MIVKVPFMTTDRVGHTIGEGFRFYCDCGNDRFFVITTEDPTVPLVCCEDCEETFLTVDLEAAQIQDTRPRGVRGG